MDEYLMIAMKMYGDTLPPPVEVRLQQVNHLAEKAGGGLYSRQAIAMIIEQYEREISNVTNNNSNRTANK